MEAREMMDRLGSGHLMDNLANALAKVSKEVLSTGEKGKVTVSLTVSKAPGDIVVVVDEALSVAMPKRKPRGAVYYVHDGEFHANDPRQGEMSLKVVENSDAVREVNDPKTTKQASS